MILVGYRKKINTPAPVQLFFMPAITTLSLDGGHQNKPEPLWLIFFNVGLEQQEVSVLASQKHEIYYHIEH